MKIESIELSNDTKESKDEEQKVIVSTLEKDPFKDSKKECDT